jgi:nucleoside-diphosphate-sugar epimerase
VTGAAGFIGSNLVERLVDDGWGVVGIDCLTPYYDVGQKRANLDELLGRPGFEFVDADLRTCDLEQQLDGIDVVFHQAGQPGVRASWDDFGSYVAHNIEVTQRLLEAVRTTPVSRFVFASSSSVYGDALAYPTREESIPQPKSPYGVTKLAAEHLCGVYARNWGVPTVSLRYFTVFGPRQRPDMAMHRLIEAALSGVSFPLFGSGAQVRDFTFVGDIVAANQLAATNDVPPGTVLNVAGGGAMDMTEVIETVERLTDRTIELDRLPVQAGDVDRTSGATDAARSVLGWVPKVSVEEGLARQVEWHRRR